MVIEISWSKYARRVAQDGRDALLGVRGLAEKRSQPDRPNDGRHGAHQGKPIGNGLTLSSKPTIARIETFFFDQKE